MKPAAFVIPKVYVLIIRFDDTTHWHLSGLLVHHRNGVCVVEKEMSFETTQPIRLSQKHPVFGLCCGAGVITKHVERSTDVHSTVIAQPERFVWTHHPQSNTFSFMQRSQIAPVFTALEGVACMDIRYIEQPAADQIQSIALARASEFYRDGFSWRELIHPSPGGALLGSTIATKARLPILGIVLLVLTGNYFYFEELNIRRQTMQAQWDLLHAQQGKENQLSDQKQQILADLGRNSPHSYSHLCDRIASIVPAGITLSELSIQPLLKSLDHMIQITTLENTVLIAGVSMHAENVALFSDQLRKESFTREVTLTRLEQQTGSGNFLFKIRLTV